MSAGEWPSCYGAAKLAAWRTLRHAAPLGIANGNRLNAISIEPSVVPPTTVAPLCHDRANVPP
jgi:hypothetical protein